MVKVTLEAENKVILLEIKENEGDWCTVYLGDGKDTIKIGSSTFKKIKEKLIYSFTCSYKIEKVKYEGKEVFLLVNLVEPHSSIYGSVLKNSGIMLYLFDLHGEFYSFLTLSEDDIHTWVNILEKVNV